MFSSVEKRYLARLITWRSLVRIQSLPLEFLQVSHLIGKAMKKELVESIANEVRDVANMAPEDRFSAISEIFAGLCLLDAIQILLVTFDGSDFYGRDRVGRLFFDVDGVDANEESQKAHRCETIAGSFARRMNHVTSLPDGTCDVVTHFLHGITEDCPKREALSQIAFLLRSSEHVRELVRNHVAAAIEDNGISTICEA
jgi:hypothetical protein